MAPEIDSSRICVQLSIKGATPLSGEFHGLKGWQWESLRSKMLRAGISPERCRWNDPTDCSVIVTMGEEQLEVWTGKHSIDKWHMSPLDSIRPECLKIIPTFDMKRMTVEPICGLYIEMAFRRAAEESATNEFVRIPERFLLNPPLDKTLEVLERLKDEPTLAIDVETGNGQINTVGFAWSESDAIAINVLPDRFGDESYYLVWKAVAAVLESHSVKVFQNFIYDVSYFSAYGIKVRGEIFDTMWAQKFLWPELEMGLDNVGRIYTKRPYWKDDGRISAEAGKRKDWGAVRDWDRHYIYNCRDTTGTFEARVAQIRDLSSRSLLTLFENFVLRFADPIREMCAVGIPVSEGRRESLRTEANSRIDELLKSVPDGLNPRSPKQVLSFIKAQDYEVPKAFDRKKGLSRESTDKKALKKLRIKYPKEPLFVTLMDLSTLQKMRSAYLDAELRGDGHLSFSLCGVGTETGRWSGGKDAWGRGFNIQTIPHARAGIQLKSIFVAPPGWQFLEVDLRQAESRFVAYDSPDANLIRMLEDPAQDIHRYVAAEIFQIPESEVTKSQRQLGKKSGHGANYSMKEGTFIESCLAEMDLVLTRKEATNVLESYHRLFPGIRRWHKDLRQQIRTTRRLTTPIGRERYFYGRLDDGMFREAYAYRPQSTIPDITNSLMLHLWKVRQSDGLPFRFCVQIHDSLLLQVPDGHEARISDICRQTEIWHPSIRLAGGRLAIPVEIKKGGSLDAMQSVE